MHLNYNKLCEFIFENSIIEIIITIFKDLNCNQKVLKEFLLLIDSILDAEEKELETNPIAVNKIYIKF